jgi:hypothetical protein
MKARASVENNTWDYVCQQLVENYQKALGRKLAEVA